MTPELTALATLTALQVVFGLAVTYIVSTRTGQGYILSSRDEAVDLTTGFVGRMHRARINNFEALIYFTPAALILALSETGTAHSAAAAWVFVATRITFIVCYALDLTPWRSIVWLIGIACIALMLLTALI